MNVACDYETPMQMLIVNYERKKNKQTSKQTNPHTGLLRTDRCKEFESPHF